MSPGPWITTGYPQLAAPAPRSCCVRRTTACGSLHGNQWVRPACTCCFSLVLYHVPHVSSATLYYLPCCTIYHAALSVTLPQMRKGRLHCGLEDVVIAAMQELCEGSCAVLWSSQDLARMVLPATAALCCSKLHAPALHGVGGQRPRMLTYHVVRHCHSNARYFVDSFQYRQAQCQVYRQRVWLVQGLGQSIIAQHPGRTTRGTTGRSGCTA